MSSTDTNQASEDELVTEVTDILNNNLHASCECHECVITWNDSDAIPLVVKLIRTEKLKLLAEVRERVIGEDEGLVEVTKRNLVTASHFNAVIKSRNQLRETIRNKLKEAEL